MYSGLDTIFWCSFGRREGSEPTRDREKERDGSMEGWRNGLGWVGMHRIRSGARHGPPSINPGSRTIAFRQQEKHTIKNARQKARIWERMEPPHRNIVSLLR